MNNEISQITSVKRTIDTIAGYLAQPELEVTAYGVEELSFLHQTKISIKVDEATSFTILLYKDKKTPNPNSNTLGSK